MCKILAVLTNSATRWQQVTSDGLALHLGLAGVGSGGVDRSVCRGRGRGRDGVWIWRVLRGKGEKPAGTITQFYTIHSSYSTVCKQLSW